MASNTVNVSTGTSFMFPFEGIWESAGLGYSRDNGSGDIAPCGNVDSNTVASNTLQVAGVVTGSGYGSNPPSPALLIAFSGDPGSLPNTLFSQVTVTKTGGTPFVFPSSNAVFNPNFFSGFPAPTVTMFAWPIGNSAALFANNVVTKLVFDLPIVLPTMTLDGEPASDSEIDLTWTDSSSPTPLANTYNLTRDGDVIATLANTVFEFNDTGLAPSTGYDYSITAMTESETVSFTFETASGVSPLNPIGGSTGQGWNNGNTSFGIPFGNLFSSPNPPVLDGNPVCAISYETASSNANVNLHIDFILAGTLTQDAFDSLDFVDSNGNTVILTSNTAVFSTTDISGFSIWLWPAPDGNPFPATGNSTYTININKAAQPLYGANASATTDDPPMPLPVQFLAAFNGDQFFTANGDLNISGNVYTYSEGTLTPCNTYTDVTGTVLNPNPITINVDGFLDTEIWTIPGTNTRIQVYDAGGTLLQDLDNIPGVPYVPGTTGEVFVIDSIFSTDTANAASANAANWLYKIANASFAFANTNANNISNVSANLAGLSSNTMIIQAGGATINVGNTINFNNTAFANIAVTPFGTDGVNVAIFANATTSGTTANSSTVINGFIFQWATYTHNAAGEAGPFTDDFPVAFPNGCLSIQLTTGGGPGAGGLVVSSFTRSAFTWYTQFAGAATTAQYLLAIGY